MACKTCFSSRNLSASSFINELVFVDQEELYRNAFDSEEFVRIIESHETGGAKKAFLLWNFLCQKSPLAPPDFVRLAKSIDFEHHRNPEIISSILSLFIRAGDNNVINYLLQELSGESDLNTQLSLLFLVANFVDNKKFSYLLADLIQKTAIGGETTKDIVFFNKIEYLVKNKIKNATSEEKTFLLNCFFAAEMTKPDNKNSLAYRLFLCLEYLPEWEQLLPEVQEYLRLMANIAGNAPRNLRHYIYDLYCNDFSRCIEVNEKKLFTQAYLRWVQNNDFLGSVNNGRELFQRLAKLDLDFLQNTSLGTTGFQKIKKTLFLPENKIILQEIQENWLCRLPELDPMPAFFFKELIYDAPVENLPKIEAAIKLEYQLNRSSERKKNKLRGYQAILQPTEANIHAFQQEEADFLESYQEEAREYLDPFYLDYLPLFPEFFKKLSPAWTQKENPARPGLPTLLSLAAKTDDPIIHNLIKNNNDEVSFGNRVIIENIADSAAVVSIYLQYLQEDINLWEELRDGHSGDDWKFLTKTPGQKIFPLPEQNQALVELIKADHYKSEWDTEIVSLLLAHSAAPKDIFNLVCSAENEVGFLAYIKALCRARIIPRDKTIKG